ncbi:MAG: class beta-lactamase-related serine hydrolase, partial [Massilia sp.]|nr:class beta-lactamase-related serine hydrolase [Massilia sp.]
MAYAGAGNGDGLVVMTNGDNGGPLAGAVVRAVAADYKWPSKQSTLRQAVALSEADQDKIAGRYVA